MSLSQKQIALFRQINLDATVALADVAWRSAERVLTLNVAVGRVLFTAQAEHGKNLLATKDPIEFIAWQATFATSCITAGVSYARQVNDIIQTSTSEAGLVLEQHQAATQKWTGDLFDTLSRFVPGGSEGVVGTLRSLARAASGVFTRVFRAARRAGPSEGSEAAPTAPAPIDVAPTQVLELHRKAA
jgi:phasin family protein